MKDPARNKPERKPFTWCDLGDIKLGRGALGEDMPVSVYRLMQYTLHDVLELEYGPDKAAELFYKAGYRAGSEFALNNIDLQAPFSGFVAELQMQLRELKIGLLRMESFDECTGEIVLTVAEDLDCSGLPISSDTVCDYDEGFIAGILELYTKRPYTVREIDCWATGDRVCRFRGRVIEP